jgi:nifR3 family TIM-barrel protein
MITAVLNLWILFWTVIDHHLRALNERLNCIEKHQYSLYAVCKCLTGVQMTLRIGSYTPQMPVFLAPMAGISDVPFRDLVSRFGAGLVVSEMIASAEMLTAKPSTLKRAELGFDADATSVQIAGRDAAMMAECARICEANGAPIIDINMGCPAKKVTGGLSGSALMREPELALDLIDAVANAVAVPVTVKMRLGWDDDSQNAHQIAYRAQEAGVQMVTVHGRTRCQFYNGHADWRAVGRVKDAVDIPVTVNGDILDAQSALAAQTQADADGLMIGRGAQGQPWILAQIAAQLTGEVPPETPGIQTRVDIILDHYDAILAFYGIELGLRVARKHLRWYLARIPGAQEVSAQVMTCNDPAKVIGMIVDLPHVLSDLELAA